MNEWTIAMISQIDLFFINECNKLKEDSFDPHRAVSAIIVNEEQEIISTGTNKPPKEMNISYENLQKIICLDSQSKYFLIEHAERNALFDAYKNKKSIKNSTMYCSLFPCADCARAISSSGIKRIVVPINIINNDRDKKWEEHYKYSREILRLSKIKIDEY